MRYYFVAAFVLSAGFAGAAKYAGTYLPAFDTTLSNLELILIGLAAFSALMAVFLSMETLRLSRRLSGTAAGFEQFESDVARRMAGIDTKIHKLNSTTTDEPLEEIRWKMAPEHEPRKIMPASRNMPLGTRQIGGNPVRSLTELPEQPKKMVTNTECAVPGTNKEKSEIAAAVRNKDVVNWYEPVVTLPERTTRYLDAKPYLQLPSGEMLSPGEWMGAVKPKSLRAEIDIQVFDQAIALARDLERESRKIGIILRLAWHETCRVANADRLLNLAKASSSHSDRILLEITQPEFFRIDRRCRDVIAQLRDLGYHFAVSQCDDAEATEKVLQSGLFSFVMPDTNLLMSPDQLAMFRRLKFEQQDLQVEIIARSIENEEAAIEMIDQNILLAQGPLFSPARPLKSSTGAGSGSERALQ